MPPIAPPRRKKRSNNSSRASSMDPSRNRNTPDLFETYPDYLNPFESEPEDDDEDEDDEDAYDDKLNPFACDSDEEVDNLKSAPKLPPSTKITSSLPRTHNGGNACVCSNNQPFTVGTQLYAFAAASIVGNTETDNCCACYQLTFTSVITGTTLIIQVTNDGGDLSGNHFDLMIPGGGEGLFNGCTPQWGSTLGSNSVWGAQYGGVSSASQCSAFPKDLQSGCLWRFNSAFKNADNPNANFKRVPCPSVLTDKSGCVRADDTTFSG